MLPTKGYFQDIECPYFNSSCGRPYCHFRHRKKQPEPTEEFEADLEKQTILVPTYKPTPKSQLANIQNNKSHIPISYVPDLAFRPDKKIRPNPTYNPTPLSILSSANNKNQPPNEGNKEHLQVINEIKQNIANVEYNPSLSVDINFEDLSNEFDLIDEIINTNKTPKNNSELKLKVNDYIGDVTNFENSDTNSSIEKNEVNQLFKEPVSKTEKNIKTESCDSSKKPDIKTKSLKSIDNKEKHSSKKSEKKHKSRHKSRSPDKEKSNKDKDKSIHKEHSSKHKSSNKSKKSDKEIEKSERTRSSESRHGSSHKKSKVKEKSHRSQSPNKHKSTKSSDKLQKDKRKDKSEEKYKETKYKDKQKETKEKGDKVKTSTDIQKLDWIDDSNVDGPPSDIELDEDETMLECYRIFNEYKPEELPQEMTQKTDISKDEDDIIEYQGKKRIAHSNTENSTLSNNHLKYTYSKPRTVETPGQIMANRYKIAKLAQANKEHELLLNEIHQSSHVKRKAPPSLLEAARERKKIRKIEPTPPSSNLIDDILKDTIKTPTFSMKFPKKIAPVQNVHALTKAKEKIILNKPKPVIKTVAQTQKGNRVAHIPDMSLSNIPDVLHADKSKLPVNVRTRFLTMIAEECVKLYISKEEAYSRALKEEFGCYEKCKVLTSYRNSAMLAVNRLRREIQERNKSGLGLIGTDGDQQNDSGVDSKVKDFYNQIKGWVLTSEELDIHGYPRKSNENGVAIVKNFKSNLPSNLDENQRICSRCKKLYQVDDDGWPLYEEECCYHPLKKRTIRGEQTYLCCKTSDETGCATSDTHVFDGIISPRLEGFQTTFETDSNEDMRSYSVFALDCEMCYTTKGLELTRVTIVDTDCKTVYESLVKPLNPIIDYNTKFSGITKEQMDRTSTSILQVQANILHLCNSRTILVGHSLESDLKVLKITHENIIDTSVLFPHKMGLPHKRALRALASEYLRKIIQNDVNGHDSAEDAVTCMELLKWKLKEEAKRK